MSNSLTRMNMVVASERLRNRCLPRFSLRAMLLFVTAVCLWLGFQVERGARQHKSVVAVTSLGGRAVYSTEYPETRVKRFLRRWLPRDCVDDVTEVWFDDDDAVSDSDLLLLRGLPRLKTLSLNKSRVTDAGLRDLRWATDLVRIDLLRTQVTDNGLAQLTALKRLKWLWLNETQITDAGMQHLVQLPELEVLSLGGNQISDAGLEHLRKSQSLREVEVGATLATRAGRERLRRYLPQCKVIDWGEIYAKSAN